MADEKERIAKLEAGHEYHEKEIRMLRDIVRKTDNYLAGQQALNERLARQHDEQREDRWQVWLRWMINPGVPVGAVLIVLWKLLTEGQIQ